MSHVSKQLQELRARILADEHAHIDSWRTRYESTTPGVAAAFKAFKETGGKMHTLARETVGKVREVRANDLAYPEGRQRLERELKDTAQAELSTLREQRALSLELLRRELEYAALPRVAKERELLARDEARMILDTSPSPGVAMLELAQRHDELAAVVTGSWGESYLRARGERRAPEVHRDVCKVAIEANAQHHDGTVRQAAAGYLALNELQMGAACTDSAVKSELEAADEPSE